MGGRGRAKKIRPTIAAMRKGRAHLKVMLVNNTRVDDDVSIEYGRPQIHFRC